METECPQLSEGDHSMNRREVFTSLGVGLVIAGTAPILLRRPVGEVFWYNDWMYRALPHGAIARIPVRYWVQWNQKWGEALVRYDIAFRDRDDKPNRPIWSQWGVDAKFGKRNEAFQHLVKTMQKNDVRYMMNVALYVPRWADPNTVGYLI
jgi:hypothetical protein